MLDNLLVMGLVPFTVALGVMLLIALIEAMGMVFGLSPSGLIDQLIPDMDGDIDFDVDVDADVGMDGDLAAEPGGALNHVLGWLCIGRVPVLVLLVAFLTIFGLVGIILQTLMNSIIGFHLPALLAVIAALIISLPPTRWLALGLARIMPKEETEAVSARSFIGKIAVITQGLARRGMPAQAKLNDIHGQTHYVLVEPDDDQNEFEQGTEVLLLRQASSSRFIAIRNTNSLMSDSGV